MTTMNTEEHMPSTERMKELLVGKSIVSVAEKNIAAGYYSGGEPGGVLTL